MSRGLGYSAACGIFSDQGSSPCLLRWQVDFFFTTEPLVKLSGKSLDKIWGNRAAGCVTFFSLVCDKVMGSYLNYSPSDSNQSGGLSTCAKPEVTTST